MRNIILWSYTHDDFSNYFQALQLRIHGKTAECMSNDFQGEVVLYITPPLGVVMFMLFPVIFPSFLGADI